MKFKVGDKLIRMLPPYNIVMVIDDNSYDYVLMYEEEGTVLTLSYQYVEYIYQLLEKKKKHHPNTKIFQLI